MACEVMGAALITYALYTLAPWAGFIAAGVFLILVGAYLGAKI